MAWTVAVFIIIPLIGLLAVGALVVWVDLTISERKAGSLESRLAPLREEGERSGLWQRIEEIVRE